MRRKFALEFDAIRETDIVDDVIAPYIDKFVKDAFLQTWESYGILAVPSPRKLREEIDTLRNEDLWRVAFTHAFDDPGTYPMDKSPKDPRLILLSLAQAKEKEVPESGSRCRNLQCCSPNCISDGGSKESIKCCTELIRMVDLRESRVFGHLEFLRTSEISKKTPHRQMWRERYESFAHNARNFVIIDKHAAIRCMGRGWKFNPNSGLSRFVRYIDQSRGTGKNVTVYSACDVTKSGKQNSVSADDIHHLMTSLESGFEGLDLKSIEKITIYLPHGHNLPQDRYIRFDETVFQVAHPLQAFEGNKGITESHTQYHRNPYPGASAEMKCKETQIKRAVKSAKSDYTVKVPRNK